MKLVIDEASVKAREANRTHGLPPSSVQSFLKDDPEIAGIHVSNHENQYSNAYYNSLLDSVDFISKTDYESMYVEHVYQVSQAVSRALFQLVTRKKAKLDPDKSLVSHGHCFLSLPLLLYQYVFACRMFFQVTRQSLQVSHATGIVLSFLRQVFLSQTFACKPLHLTACGHRFQVKQSLDCLLFNSTCLLFQEVAADPVAYSAVNSTIPLYVSVVGNQKRQSLVASLRGLLIMLTGEEMSGVSRDACDAMSREVGGQRRKRNTTNR